MRRLQISSLIAGLALGLLIGWILWEEGLLRSQPSTGGPSFESLNVEGDLTVGGTVTAGGLNIQAAKHQFIRTDGSIAVLPGVHTDVGDLQIVLAQPAKVYVSRAVA